MSTQVICEIVCIVVCLAHAVIGWLRGRSTDKKISALCDKCGMPVIDGVKHDCELSAEQLEKLVNFVKSIKEVK